MLKSALDLQCPPPTLTLISPYPFLKDNCSWLQFWLGINPTRATHLALATHSMVTSEVPATTLVFLGGMMMVGAMGSAGPPTSEKRSSIRRVESEIPSLPTHVVHGDFSTQSTEYAIWEVPQLHLWTYWDCPLPLLMSLSIRGVWGGPLFSEACKSTMPFHSPLSCPTTLRILLPA